MAFSRKLTLDFIKLKTNLSKTNQIKTLNLWGNDFEDISILSELPKLEVVSLSVNHIKNLEVFQKLENLKELYLRQNLIDNFDQIKYLEKCHNLSILALKDNPITLLPDYKKKIIEILPQLKKLDEDVIDPNFIQNQNNKINKSVIVQNKNNITTPYNKKEAKKLTINTRESIGLDNSQNPFEKNMQSEGNVKEKDTKKEKENIKEKGNIKDKEKDKNEATNILKTINESVNQVNITENKLKKLEKEDIKTSKSISNFKEFIKKNKEPFKKKEIKFEFVEKRNKKIQPLEKLDSHKLTQSFSVADFNALKTQYQKKIIPNFKREIITKTDRLETNNYNTNYNTNNPLISSQITPIFSRQFKNNLVNHNKNRNTVIQSIKLLLTTIDSEGLEELKNEIENLLMNKK
jgi:hypothetical protein